MMMLCFFGGGGVGCGGCGLRFAAGVRAWEVGGEREQGGRE